jgi:hypothetical protein
MLGRAGRTGGYDFTSYLLSSNALRHNQNPYLTDSPFPYIYPLFLAAILIPLTFLPYLVNNIIWFIVSIGSFCLTVYYLNLLFDINIKTKNNYLFIFFSIVIVLFNPIQNNLLNGQVNFLVILFSVLYFFFEKKNSFLASFFLAGAISIKIVPAIILIYTLTEKKYKDLIWIALFSCLFIFILPYIFTGNNLPEYYRYYLQKFILSSFIVGGNASYTFTLYGNIKNILFVPDEYAFYLQIFSVLIILLPVVLLYIKINKEKLLRKNLIMIALLSASILLISPSSETHHQIFLIPAVYLIIKTISEKRDKDRILFLIYFILFFLSFWMGSILKSSLLIFLSIIILYITIFFSTNKIGTLNGQV